MSNRDDFDRVTDELIEMFGLDPNRRNKLGELLRHRLKTEMHNAYVAGQEAAKTTAENPAWAEWRARMEELERKQEMP